MNRILIVDDEESILPLARRAALEDEGFATDGEPTTATSGRSNACGPSEPPDLVLLDIAMPGRDGLEVLEELARGEWPHLPIVMMSGHGTIETAVKRHAASGRSTSSRSLLALDKHPAHDSSHALKQLEREAGAARFEKREAIRHEILGSANRADHEVAQGDQISAVAAPTNGWVLITGENGTGKELVARSSISHSGAIADGPSSR